MSPISMQPHVMTPRAGRPASGRSRVKAAAKAAVRSLGAPAALAAAVLLTGPAPLAAQGVLGSAQPFAVLGATTVTNTGATTIKGNLGVYPGLAITGMGTITQTGAVYQGGPVAKQAQADALTAYNTFAALPCMTSLTGQNLGGLTLTPGVYCFASSAQLTGTLTLNFMSNPSAAFVFQVGSALTTASASSVAVLNGGAGSGVYFQLGSSATLGTGTAFQGNLLANQSITLNTGATIICGRAIALNGAVTLDHNTISNDCRNGGDFGTGTSDFGSLGYSGGPGVTATPEPATLALLGGGLLALGGGARIRRRHA
jgi:hypothetical protein